MITNRDCYITVLLLFILASVQAQEEKSLKAQNIEIVSPEYIDNVSVVDKDDGVQIEGETAGMQNVSRYLRFLQDAVGDPNLVQMTREGDVQHFIIEIKKFK